MHDSTLLAEEARRIGRDAYVFGFAFVANYRVFINNAATRSPIMLGAGFNEFAHYPDVIAADTPDTAQQDTLYSFAVLDLRREPIVISVPDVAEPNSYMLQLGDTSTETLPYISTITTGNRAGVFAMVGPDFQGLLPATGLDGVITTRGQFVIVLGRVSILDPDDLAPLHQIQTGMALTPLSSHLGTTAPPEPPPIDFPQWDDERAAGANVFTYINTTLAWHPPASGEMSTMAEFARIGVLPGQPFSTDDMSPEIVAAIEAGVEDARAAIEANVERFTAQVNGWNWSTDDISRFGTDYLTRSTVALKNIYPNAPDHAIYGQAFRDFNDEILDGNHLYEVTFPPGEQPPVDWFWSLTLYDESTTMYPNPTGRTNIGDRTAGLVYGDDGSLTITVTHNEPAEPANWLPAPAGPFYLVVRNYGAKRRIVEGDWTPPPIQRVG
jgi:hypothetical protein